MPIPLVDLRAQYLAIKPEIDEAVASVIGGGVFVGGREVSSFEEEFARFCGAANCVGVANGTDALYLALRALGIGRGDEVITVSHTFIATAEAITLTGATPVFIDVRDDTLLMDPDLLEAAVTPRTRAVIPVHLYGHVCDIGRIMEVARRSGLKVVEDAAQAHGATWRGRRVGTLGDVGCFSFYPGKNLGAYGDGGAVVSMDAALTARIRMLANHGRREKYLHETPGVNSRLDTLQAAILRVKLRHLEAWNEARRGHSAAYMRELSARDLRLPVTTPGSEPVWHLFVVRTSHRDRLRDRLKEKGIETGIHYPVPLHRQPAYAEHAVARAPCPVAERAASEVVSLPMFPELSGQQRAEVADEVRSGEASGADRTSREDA